LFCVRLMEMMNTNGYDFLFSSDLSRPQCYKTFYGFLYSARAFPA
jgi:hypothetical protein